MGAIPCGSNSTSTKGLTHLDIKFHVAKLVKKIWFNFIYLSIYLSYLSIYSIYLSHLSNMHIYLISTYLNISISFVEGKNERGACQICSNSIYLSFLSIYILSLSFFYLIYDIYLSFYYMISI